MFASGEAAIRFDGAKWVQYPKAPNKPLQDEKNLQRVRVMLGIPKGILTGDRSNLP